MAANEARILEFLLNALWQVPCVALAAWAADRWILRRCRAALRFHFWLCAIALAILLPWLPAWPVAQPVPVFRIWMNSGTVDAALSVPVGASRGGRMPWATVAITGYVVFALARIALRLARLRQLDESNTVTPLTFARRIIIPARFASEAPELARRAAVAHEQAHLDRRDFDIQLLVEFATIPVAWHPAMSWVRRQLARVRELACDEQDARTFADPADYARGLVEAAELLARRTQPSPALGLFDVNDFEERIQMLTQPVRTISAAAARWAVAGALMLLTAAAGSTVMLAVAVEDQPASSLEPGVTPPRIKHRVEAAYTNEAREAKISGAVRLSLVVNEGGLTENIQVVGPLDPGLDRAAIDAVSQWQFEPAQKNGQPVPVAATVEVNFRLMNYSMAGDVPPRVKAKKEPEYPAAAKAARIGGSVWLLVKVTETGAAENVTVVQSLDPRLDQAAVEAVRQWKFEPAQRNGAAVAAMARVEVQFRIE